jgi:MFS family permease
MLAQRPFRLLWLAHTMSAAGSAITQAILPILLYQLTGSVVQTAALLLMTTMPYLLLGLPAGAVADRTNRRRVMLVGCAAGALVVGSAAIASAAGLLHPAQVYAVATLAAVCFVWIDASEAASLPALVTRAQLAEANSALTAGTSTVTVVAPAAGVALAAAAGPSTALALDAASYLAALIAIARIPVPLGSDHHPSRPHPPLTRDIWGGLGYVRRHPLLRPLTTIALLNAVMGGTLFALLVVFAVRQLGLPDNDARLGLPYAATAAGAVLAAVCLPRLRRRTGPTRLTLWALPTGTGLLALLAGVHQLALALPLLLVWSTAYSLVTTNGIALRQELAPADLQGRVNASARVVAWAGYPLGAVMGGLLTAAHGLPAALLTACAAGALATLLAWISALRHRTVTPDQAADPPRTAASAPRPPAAGATG